MFVHERAVGENQFRLFEKCVVRSGVCRYPRENAARSRIQRRAPITNGNGENRLFRVPVRRPDQR